MSRCGEKTSTAVVTGHEVRFVDHVDSDWICTICQELIQNANETDCGHLFCGHCLRSWMANHNTCPMCRAVNDRSQISAARYIDRNIQNVNIWCPNDCGEKITVRALKNHLSSDCEKAKTKCPMCDKEVFQKELEKHCADLHISAMVKLSREAKFLPGSNEGPGKRVPMEYSDRDILVDGRDGTNAFINGVWRFSGLSHGYPFYKKGTDFMYRVEQRWRISRKLGEPSKINAFFDSKALTAGDHAACWFVFDGEYFAPDQQIVSKWFPNFDFLVRGCKGPNSRFNGLWIQRGAHDFPHYVKKSGLDSDLFMYFNGVDRWLITAEISPAAPNPLAFLAVNFAPMGGAKASPTPDFGTLGSRWQFRNANGVYTPDSGMTLMRYHGGEIKIRSGGICHRNLDSVWIQRGSLNTRPYYTSVSNNPDNVDDTRLYLFRNRADTKWLISPVLDSDEGVIAQTDNASGSGEHLINNWTVWDGKEWKKDDAMGTMRWYKP